MQHQSSSILYEKLQKCVFVLIIFLKIDLSTLWVTWVRVVHRTPQSLSVLGHLGDPVLTGEFRSPSVLNIHDCCSSSAFHFQCQLFNLGS